MNRRFLNLPPLGLALLATVACLAPFANKAIHIDDPLFLWTARQIQAHPLDPYGFQVNWYGTMQPMSEVISNPPWVPAYAALLAAVFGWSEVSLHLGFLVPALLAVWGTFVLARRFCSQPLLATLAAVLTPVFLVSGTTLMCDMSMLAFWVWTLVWWERGLRENRGSLLVLAALLNGLAILSKFNGFTLWPLLVVYGFLVKRRPGWWLVPLLIPLGMLGGFEWWTRHLYGKGLFLATSTYAAQVRIETQSNVATGFVGGLVFTGGCLLPVVFFAPLLWPRRVCLAGLGLGLLAVFALPSSGVGSLKWGDAAQATVLAFIGVSVLALAIMDAARYRDAGAALLGLWALGTFVYASVVNWTVNARGFLPLVPALGLLLARRLDRGEDSSAKGFPLRTVWPLALAAIASLLVTQADYNLASAARAAARQIAQTHRPAKGTLWFQGHWGFQYYLEPLGGRALDLRSSQVARGDVMVFPVNNSNVYDAPRNALQLLENMTLAPNHWLATMERERVGFYAAAFGPLPLAVGRVRAEEYRIYQAARPLSFQLTPAAR